MASIEMVSPSIIVTLLALARPERPDGYIFIHHIVCELEDYGD
jgi:hypothetical protein